MRDIEYYGLCLGFRGDCPSKADICPGCLAWFESHDLELPASNNSAIPARTHGQSDGLGSSPATSTCINPPSFGSAI